ncbi:FAD-binding protein [Paenarthrobacter nitroguajacolicus]|uniref:FAD-dependent oxidoreductase n=1 Tax=Paenarthrobacter nitroguajacolicus TaxID=211146 RepID=UPI0015B9FD49|nr:FAD-dependent monooxygenase [Paenarthrobacter nitroguajacolicus]NWL10281.1 FAD-binding protein [Paenarthrobacter nitroguajacolicus]
MALKTAVVIGGSIAGLLAAAVLSESFDEVLIVDRDELPIDIESSQIARRGVPQSNQIHKLLPLGKERIETILPGFDDELIALGCESHDEAARFTQYINGGWGVRANSDLITTYFRRPVFEWVMRRRVLALDNVTAVKAFAIGLVSSADRSAVVGVRIKNKPDLQADLVVDASGRGSKSPNWIEDLSYTPPQVAELRAYMGYATFTVELPPGLLPEGLQGAASVATPNLPKGGTIQPCGNGLHTVAAYGIMRNYPPGDLDGVIQFLEEGASPLVAEWVKNSRLVGDIETYTMTGNQRRLWEEMPRRPEGLVVLGDAVTSFNPIYGQGMTMAAVGATILREAVNESGGTVEGIATRVQKELAPWADTAFSMAAGSDSAFEGVEFVNIAPPSAHSRETSRVLNELRSEDVEVFLAMKTAAAYLDPSFLDTESIRTKVAGWKASGRTINSAYTNPRIVPPAP